MIGFAMAAEAAFVLTLCALTSNEAIAAVLHHPDVAPMATRSSLLDLHQLRPHFERSEEEHSSSMSAIMLNMTRHSALEILRKNKKVSPEFLAFAQTASSRTRLRVSAHKASRGPITVPAGYSTVDGAKYMLNRLLEESMSKYDMETLKCRDYYSKQCGMIEAARGTIAGAAQKGVGCRAKLLSTQGHIETLESNMPKAKQLLSEHKQKCKDEMQVLRNKLKVVEDDIGTTSNILGMTGCAQIFLQTNHTHHTEKQVKLLKCRHKCNGASFVSLDHAPLRHHIDKLKSHVAHALLQQSFGDLAGESHEDGDSDGAGYGYSGGDGDGGDWHEFNSITVHRTTLPEDPCSDPNGGHASPLDKRTAKCTVSGAASCVTLQEHFGLMQGGLVDEKDAMHSELGELSTKCVEAEKTLSVDITKQEQTLRMQQTKLAEAMSCEAEAGEEGRLSNMEFNQMTAELHKMKKGCSHTFRELETEMCGLRKIRMEIYTKMQGTSQTTSFQDCKVSDWMPGECSKPCGGGVQQMTRTVEVQSQGGASCLPLEEMRSCNEQPCPVDCRLSPFGGWSSCTAECGGGIRQRLRDIERPAMHGGNPCGEVSETQPCNVQSCEADCQLGDWTEWAPCSKQCDGGTRKRIKRVAVQAVGSGDCPAIESPDREEYKKCNAHACPKLQAKTTVTCKSKVDLILAIDGSGSLGQDGWDSAKAAAKMIIEAMDATLAEIAVLLYSGPQSWASIKKCMSPEAVNQETICKLHWVEHLKENNKGAALTSLQYLQWPKGNTLTSLALYTALAETQLGREDAETVVVVITDGKPFSEKRTYRAAKALRKVARLMFVPITEFAPLSFVRKLASKPVEENVLVAQTFAELKQPSFVDHIIADICPVLD